MALLGGRVLKTVWCQAAYQGCASAQDWRVRERPRRNRAEGPLEQLAQELREPPEPLQSEA